MFDPNTPDAVDVNLLVRAWRTMTGRAAVDAEARAAGRASNAGLHIASQEELEDLRVDLTDWDVDDCTAEDTWIEEPLAMPGW